MRKVLTKDFNWIFHVESAIKQVHTFFYNKGHKRKSILREFMKGVRATFGGDFQTRWSAAEKKAITNILKHYPHLIGSLTEMGKSDGHFAKDANTRNTANGMVKTLTDKSCDDFAFSEGHFGCFGDDISAISEKIWNSNGPRQKY